MLESLYSWGIVCGFLGWVLAILTGVGLLAFVLLRDAQRQTVHLHQAWEQFAQVNGLTFDPESTPAYPHLSGTYRQRAVTLSLIRLRPRPGRFYTQVTSTVKMPTETQLQVSQFTQVGPYYYTLPGPDIFMEVGVFANQYRAQGNAPDLARSVLSATVQSAIMEARLSHLSLAKGNLTLRVGGMESQLDRLRALLDLTCTVAEAIEV